MTGDQIGPLSPPGTPDGGWVLSVSQTTLERSPLFSPHQRPAPRNPRVCSPARVMLSPLLLWTNLPQFPKVRIPVEDGARLLPRAVQEDDGVGSLGGANGRQGLQVRGLVAGVEEESVLALEDLAQLWKSVRSKFDASGTRNATKKTKNAILNMFSP